MSANSNKRKADETNPYAENWAKFKVSALKAELERRGLDIAGKKAELIQRLEDNVGGDEGTIDNNEPVTVPQKVVKKLAKSKAEKTGWNALSTTELKAECSARRISTGGAKGDLVERLDDDDAEKILVSDPNYAPMRDENALRTGESRLYPFQPRPDSDFKERYKKARKERMIMLGRKKSQDKNGTVQEVFDIAGSRGSIYVTTIGCMFHCDCMDFRLRGLRCKHIIYALVIILKTPIDVASQIALLPSEVKEIFKNAPVTQELHFDIEQDAYPGLRKPVDGDCPICVFEFEEGEDLLWCKAACGQNVHKSCFEEWKAAKANDYAGVKCVYCRALWIEGNDGLSKAETLKKAAPKIGSYKNVAHLDFYKNAPAGSED